MLMVTRLAHIAAQRRTMRSHSQQGAHMLDHPFARRAGLLSCLRVRRSRIRWPARPCMRASARGSGWLACGRPHSAAIATAVPDAHGSCGPGRPRSPAAGRRQRGGPRPPRSAVARRAQRHGAGAPRPVPWPCIRGAGAWKLRRWGARRAGGRRGRAAVDLHGLRGVRGRAGLPRRVLRSALAQQRQLRAVEVRERLRMRRRGQCLSLTWR